MWAFVFAFTVGLMLAILTILAWRPIAVAAENNLPRTATFASPATILLPEEDVKSSDASALELQVRPTHVVKDAAYLVQVFATTSGTPENDVLQSQNLLGTFSLYRIKEGETQSFIVPSPTAEKLWAGGSVIAVQLVPAHPDRDLGDTSLEVVGARWIK